MRVCVRTSVCAYATCCLQLAATQIQRLFRGHMGRQRFQRKKAWNATAPGPDRLKLGIKIIENSKEAYDRQKQEIEALQRAQTRAETRVTTISSSLKESEEDLAVIHKELLEIDQVMLLSVTLYTSSCYVIYVVQLDRQLHDLSEEKVKLESSVDSLDSGLSRMSASDLQMIAGKRSKQLRDMNTLEVRPYHCSPLIYMLQMHLQLSSSQKLILDKKAERELKKQDLEAEFAAVFAEVKEKKTELKRLEGTIQEMEAQRLRKDREFARLQVS